MRTDIKAVTERTAALEAGQRGPRHQGRRRGTTDASARYRQHVDGAACAGDASDLAVSANASGGLRLPPRRAEWRRRCLVRGRSLAVGPARQRRERARALTDRLAAAEAKVAALGTGQTGSGRVRCAPSPSPRSAARRRATWHSPPTSTWSRRSASPATTSPTFGRSRKRACRARRSSRPNFRRSPTRSCRRPRPAIRTPASSSAWSRASAVSSRSVRPGRSRAAIRPRSSRG